MKMIVILSFLLAVTTASSSSLRKQGKDVEKVMVGFYSESLCPDCIALSTGPLNDAIEKVSRLAYVYVYVDIYDVYPIIHVISYVKICK